MTSLNPVSFQGNIRITTYKHGKPRVEEFTTLRNVDSLIKRLCFDNLPKNAKTTELTRRNSEHLKTLIELVTGKPLKNNPDTKQTLSKPKFNKFIYEDIYSFKEENSGIKQNGVSVIMDFNA
ncbi:MAG: hypothetical protein ACLSWI_01035 [Candidatus Gastranaerophilaceae bacterium]